MLSLPVDNNRSLIVHGNCERIVRACPRIVACCMRLPQPCPGDYNLKGVAESKVGARIGNSNPKSDLEWKIYRAKQVPGPGEYEVVE